MSVPKKIKPSLSKGTRDFLPLEVEKRNHIFRVIKDVFYKYGFQQIETPAIERLETLMGKYGEEGDKLLFKILNSGDFLGEIRNAKQEIRNLDAREITPLISEKGLRYDLTVPLARYVVQHQDDLAFPFRRFHIGPVWRADRPQKGRYQEFYQCDADIIGSSSLLNEVELTCIYLEVFTSLGIDAIIRINNRKLIDYIIHAVDASSVKGEIIAAIDKLDKIHWSGDKGVASLLRQLGLSEEQIDDLNGYLFNVNYLLPNEHLNNNELAYEINTLISNIPNSPNIYFDATLMRGLDYYTGTIWEVILNKHNPEYKDITIGSLGGGGRYDNLTEMFGGQNMSGVGISFGIERIYDVMEELNLFPPAIAQGVKVLFVPRNETMQNFTFQQVQALRNSGVAAEIFLGNVKKQKHFDYVTAKNIAYLVEVGEDEQKSGQFRLRNTRTRETENNLDLRQLTERLK